MLLVIPSPPLPLAPLYVPLQRVSTSTKFSKLFVDSVANEFIFLNGETSRSFLGSFTEIFCARVGTAMKLVLHVL